MVNLISGYAHASIHVRMLCDEVRTTAFRRAIEAASPGRTVVELGTGSGILACFAARAGAKRVYAIEQTEIIELAREIAITNGLSERIEFIRANSRDVELGDRADLVIAELIGNDPLAEGLVQLQRDAARRFLKPGGTSIPASLELHAIAVDSAIIRLNQLHAAEETAQAWTLSDSYGLDLSPLARAYERELRTASLSESVFMDLAAQAAASSTPSEQMLTAPVLVQSFDLTCTKGNDTRWSRRVCLEAQRGGTANAIATYWRARLDADTELSMAPDHANRTHWGAQMLSPIHDVALGPGDALCVRAQFDLARTPTTLTWEAD